jgi:hypothetical protein
LGLNKTWDSNWLHRNSNSNYTYLQTFSSRTNSNKNSNWLQRNHGTCNSSYSVFLHNDFLLRNYLNLIYSNETFNTPLTPLILRDLKKIVSPVSPSGQEKTDLKETSKPLTTWTHPSKSLFFRNLEETTKKENGFSKKTVESSSFLTNTRLSLDQETLLNYKKLYLSFSLNKQKTNIQLILAYLKSLYEIRKRLFLLNQFLIFVSLKYVKHSKNKQYLSKLSHFKSHFNFHWRQSASFFPLETIGNLKETETNRRKRCDFPIRRRDLCLKIKEKENEIKISIKTQTQTQTQINSSNSAQGTYLNQSSIRRTLDLAYLFRQLIQTIEKNYWISYKYNIGWLVHNKNIYYLKIKMGGVLGVFVDGGLSPKDNRFSDSFKYSLPNFQTLNENSSSRVLGRILKFLCVFTGSYLDHSKKTEAEAEAEAEAGADKKLSKFNQNLNLESNWFQKKNWEKDGKISVCSISYYYLHLIYIKIFTLNLWKSFYLFLTKSSRKKGYKKYKLFILNNIMKPYFFHFSTRLDRLLSSEIQKNFVLGDPSKVENEWTLFFNEKNKVTRKTEIEQKPSVLVQVGSKKHSILLDTFFSKCIQILQNSKWSKWELMSQQTASSSLSNDLGTPLDVSSEKSLNTKSFQYQSTDLFLIILQRQIKRLTLSRNITNILFARTDYINVSVNHDLSVLLTSQTKDFDLKSFTLLNNNNSNFTFNTETVFANQNKDSEIRGRLSMQELNSSPRNSQKGLPTTTHFNNITSYYTKPIETLPSNSYAYLGDFDKNLQRNRFLISKVKDVSKPLFLSLPFPSSGTATRVAKKKRETDMEHMEHTVKGMTKESVRVTMGISTLQRNLSSFQIGTREGPHLNIQEINQNSLVPIHQKRQTSFSPSNIKVVWQNYINVSGTNNLAQTGMGINPLRKLVNNRTLLNLSWQKSRNLDGSFSSSFIGLDSDRLFNKEKISRNLDSSKSSRDVIARTDVNDVTNESKKFEPTTLVHGFRDSSRITRDTTRNKAAEAAEIEQTKRKEIGFYCGASSFFIPSLTRTFALENSVYPSTQNSLTLSLFKPLKRRENNSILDKGKQKDNISVLIRESRETTFLGSFGSSRSKEATLLSETYHPKAQRFTQYYLKRFNREYHPIDINLKYYYSRTHSAYTLLENLSRFLIAFIKKNKGGKNKFQQLKNITYKVLQSLTPNALSSSPFVTSATNFSNSKVMVNTNETVKGLAFRYSGRVYGATKAMSFKMLMGSVPFSTLKADIDYAQLMQKTRNGTWGFRLWLHLGRK